jgi:hypothetical protein
MLYICIREALGSILAAVFRFPQFVKANAEIVPRLRHDRFLTNPFSFICHRSIQDYVRGAVNGDETVDSVGWRVWVPRSLAAAYSYSCPNCKWREFESVLSHRLRSYLHSSLAYSWFHECRSYPALKMGAVYHSETSISAYKTTWCHNPEDM